MERIFQHEDGSLFIKMDYFHLYGIFRLQLVSPLNCTVDSYWFENALNKREISELRALNEENSREENKEEQHNAQDDDYEEYGCGSGVPYDDEQQRLIDEYGEGGFETDDGHFFPESWDPS